MTPQEKFTLAGAHLERVQSSWDPPDWAILSMFGPYCLEAVAEAAALTVGLEASRKHHEKADLADRLHIKFRPS